MRARRTRLTLMLVMMIAFLPARHALAGPEGVKRSIEHIVLCPAELAVFPVVAGQTLHHNMQVAEYSTPQKVLFAPIGFAWLSLVQVSYGFARGVAGIVSLLPALAFVASDKDPTSRLDISRYPALVDEPTRYFDFKFGVYQAWR